MFKHEGPSRSPRQNAVLAAYLALVGGYVNSAGFVLIGTFTSHVTGNVGRLANDVAGREWGASAATATMIAAFLLGAFVASVIIETDAYGSPARAYGTSLLLESALLVAFLVAANCIASPIRLAGVGGSLLSAAMGVQNSLVTRLSGAVIRTTHLTGVVTDIGIEGARWFRWWRRRASESLGFTLLVGLAPERAPSRARIGLLAIIALTFTFGAMTGAAATTALRQWALAFPIASLTLGGAYAFASVRSATPSQV
jgi:uncharacterized membrane protein YoaK (UPF0700 family)